MKQVFRFAVLLKRLGIILLTVFIALLVLNIYWTLIPNIWYRQHLAFTLVALWFLSAYLVLPRIHRVLTRIYLPAYFVGRTRTPDGLLSDPINLAINGSKNALIGAMTNAGWEQADARTLKTMFRIVAAAIMGRSYPNAPVSDLFVFGKKQDLVFQIQEDGNPRKRHHVRFWRVPRAWYLPGGYKVDWVGAATYDDAVGISLFTWQITHSIDANIDVERDFLISSLRDANQLRSSTRVEHYFVGYKSRNGVNGSHMVTDGSLVIADLLAESHARAASGVQHANLDSIQQEIYNMAKVHGSPDDQNVDTLIKQMRSELEDVQNARSKKRASGKIAEEAVDVLIKSVQLIGALGQNSSDIYRERMDQSWKKHLKDKDIK